MKKIEIVVKKDEITVIGNRYLYGNNTKTQTKGDFLEAYIRRELNPNDAKWYVKNSDAYDVASDIETATGEKISVKSGEFSLTEALWSYEYNETEKQKIIGKYADTVHSDHVIYAWLTDKNENEYIINGIMVDMNVFVEFLKVNAVMTIVDTKTKRYKIKVKKSMSTVIKELTRIDEGGF